MELFPKNTKAGRRNNTYLSEIQTLISCNIYSIHTQEQLLQSSESIYGAHTSASQQHETNGTV